MRSWLAGSITLGTALVAFGLSMLVSKVTGAFSITDVVVWWPVLLILLGCEVLAAVFFSDDKPMKIRFSGGSIFLITVLICFSLLVSAAEFTADVIRGYDGFPHVRVTEESNGLKIVISSEK